MPAVRAARSLDRACAAPRRLAADLAGRPPRAGPPGSGKSTIAALLAVELGLPLLAKDAVKEALIEALGWPATVEESRLLGRAAVLAVFTVARTSPGAVLDSTFYEYTRPLVEALPGPHVEVRCRVSWLEVDS